MGRRTHAWDAAPARGAWRLACVALLATAGSACSPPATITPDRLPDLMRLKEGETIRVEMDGREVSVGPQDDPRLVVELTRRCSMWEVQRQFHPVFRLMFGRAEDAPDCRPPMNLPIELVSAEGSRLRLEAYDGSAMWGAPQNEEMEVDAGEVHALRLQVYRPDRPRIGVGFAILGPSRFGGIQFQFLPMTWLGLEAGLGGVPDLGASLWTGVRVRPIEWGAVRPFVGAFAALTAFGEGPEPGDEEQHDRTRRERAFGPRLGADLQLGRWMVLTLEADAVRIEDAGGDVYAGPTRWTASGGGAISVVF